MKTLMSVKTEGQTPSGRGFSINAHHFDGESQIVSRSIQWEAFGEVGSFGIPLKLIAPVGLMFYELTRNGSISPETHSLCFP